MIKTSMKTRFLQSVLLSAAFFIVPVHAETFDGFDADADSVGNPIDFTSGGGVSSNCSTRGDRPTTSSSTSQNSFSLTVGDKSVMRQDYSCNSQGEILFENDGEWTVPECVTSISVVAVGGGGAGGITVVYQITDPNAVKMFETHGSNGGDMRWASDVAVTPGQKISVSVGKGASWDGSSTTYTVASGDYSGNWTTSKLTGGSSVMPSSREISLELKNLLSHSVATQNSAAAPTIPMCHGYFAGGRIGGDSTVTVDGTVLLVAAGGLGFGTQGVNNSRSSQGQPYNHSTINTRQFSIGTGGGGVGGQGTNTVGIVPYWNVHGSGGGAASYAGAGGDAEYHSAMGPGVHGYNGWGGSGGGGSGGSGGGGVGIYGLGASGSYPNGTGGSGGEDSSGVNGGKYGGGGGVRFAGGHVTPQIGKGGDGVVRIMWGVGRTFPNNAGYIAP